MAYIECRNWFDWIKEEIQNQMSQWKNIVPSRDFGLLPTINKLDVEMTDKKILLNDKPMKFSLDERSAIELLQGNNLYENDMSIYRELIQNAIDATMVRVWLEHEPEKSQEPLPLNANPYDENTRKIFEKYPIELDCRKIADNDNSTLWEFSIEDHGMGISRKDLEYMQRIAGSKNNKEKQKIIRQMPEWMQPSGEFGIGLHSAFLLMKDLPVEKQKIILFTKIRLTHESLKVELNSPLSGKAGYCFIEKVDDLDHYGTKLIINVRMKNNSVFENDRFLMEEFESRIYYEYDSDELVVLRKIQSIYRNVNNNTVSFKLNSNLKFNSPISKNIDNRVILNRSNMYWDDEKQSAIKPLLLEYGEAYDRKSLTRFINSRSRKSIITFYKGQILNHSSTYSIDYFPTNIRESVLLDGLFHLIIDIYSSNTKDIVTLSRDEVKDINIVKDKFLKSYGKLLYSIEHKDYDSIQLFDGNIRKNSLFLKLNDFSTNDTWKGFKISDTYTINDLLNKEKITTYDSDNTEYLELVKVEEIEILKSRVFDKLMTNRNFRKILNDYGFNIYYLHKKPSFGSLLSKKDLENDLFYRSFEFDEVSFSESMFENSKFNLNDILKAYTHRLSTYTHKLSSINYRENLTHNLLAIEDIKESLSLSIENKNLFQFIKIEVSQRHFIVFPFVVIENNIVEIANKKLYEIFNNMITSKFEDYDEAYNVLKDIIINYAKDKYPKWYESYIAGKNFTPIDLTRLNKLHEPSSK